MDALKTLLTKASRALVKEATWDRVKAWVVTQCADELRQAGYDPAAPATLDALEAVIEEEFKTGVTVDPQEAQWLADTFQHLFEDYPDLSIEQIDEVVRIMVRRADCTADEAVAIYRSGGGQ